MSRPLACGASALLVSALAAAVPSAAAADREEGPDPERAGLAIPSNIVFSADGGSIAWELTRSAPDERAERTRVYLREVGGGFPLEGLARAITRLKKERPSRPLTRAEDDARDPAFSPDGKALAFLATRGSGASPQVWWLSLEGGEAEAWTDAPGAVVRFVWANDGSIFFVAPADSTAAAANGIWKTPPEGGEAELLHRGREAIVDLVLSFDQRWIAFEAGAAGETDLWKLDVRRGEVGRLTERAGEERSPRWAWGSERVLFLASRDPADPRSAPGVFAVALEGGPVELVTPTLEGRIRELVACEGSDRLFGVVDEDAGSFLVRIHPRSKRVYRLHAETGRIRDLAVRSDGEKAVFVWEASGIAPEIGTWSFPDDYLEILTRLNLAPAATAGPQPEDEG